MRWSPNIVIGVGAVVAGGSLNLAELAFAVITGAATFVGVEIPVTGVVLFNTGHHAA